MEQNNKLYEKVKIKVYNVLTRKKEDFLPLEEGRIKMYVCGPTVYDHAHIGHAKVYVGFDTIIRFFRYLGYNVRYVQNITDVGHLLDSGEDRILKGAARENLQPMEMVETYTRSYFEDMDALGVVRPDISPRASGHIPEQIEMINTLIDKGYAYESDGSVYFSVSEFSDYGKLSRRVVEELKEGARIEISHEKRNPEDFALWKKAEPEHIMRWNSPWGSGFPGWHIECSAMSSKYLGETFDIHGGGIDNIFPHNECEIAQSEAASGKPFADYWFLGGTLTVDGTKMSKSLGNFLTIKDALKRFPPEAIRFFILSGHYASPIDFSEEALAGAARGLERLHETVRNLREQIKSAPQGEEEEDWDDYHKRFIESMSDDFNTAAGISVLFDMSKKVNGLMGAPADVTRKTLEGADRIYSQLGGKVLGIIPDSLEDTSRMGDDLEEGLMKLLIQTRKDLRDIKQWKLADMIRDSLSELGMVLEDRSDGTVWKRKK